MAGLISFTARVIAVWAHFWLSLLTLLWKGQLPSRFLSPEFCLQLVRSHLDCLVERLTVLGYGLLFSAIFCIQVVVKRLVDVKSRYKEGSTMRGVAPCKWITHHTVRIRGTKIHYVEAGRREGRRLFLLLHGFPEFWYSWRHQLKEFSKSEWVVAPDLPGYGDSDQRTRSRMYDIENTVLLIQELITLLGRDECVVVGSDFGALIGWRLIQVAPQCCSRFISLSQPLCHVTMDVLDTSFHQKWKRWLLYLFQVPWLPEYLIANGDLDLVAKEYGPLLNSRIITDTDMAAYRFVFSENEDWFGPVSYYRHLFGWEGRRPPSKRLETPCLLLFGSNDVTTAADARYQSLCHLQNGTVQIVQGGYRRLSQECPDQVNLKIREFVGAAAAVEVLEESDEATDECPEDDQFAIEPSPPRWPGLGGAIYNQTVKGVKAASAITDLYSRSLKLLK